MFRAPAMLLPHESTVAHEQRFIMDAPMISRTRSRMALGSLSTMDSLQKVDDIKDAQVGKHHHFVVYKETNVIVS